MPKITVIIPIYNVEKYISKCLDSMLQQSFEDFEVWAIDDGSPDRSADIVREYVEKDKRIRLIQKENGGYGSVLQYAIRNIESKYFLICDPDDWITSDALEKMYLIAEKNCLDILTCDRYDVYTEDYSENYRGVVSEYLHILPNKVYEKQQDIQKFSMGEATPHAKLYRTEIAKHIEFPSKVSYTDGVLYLVSLTRSKRVMYYNKAYAYYLIDRPGNSVTDKSHNVVKSYIACWNAIYEQIKNETVNLDYMYYKLFMLLKTILVDYACYADKDHEDIYKQQILDIRQKLIPKQKNIESAVRQKGLQWILYKGIFHPQFYRLFFDRKLVALYKKIQLRLE